MKIFCCREHIERALDEIIYECEEAPFLNDISEKESGNYCKYCDQASVYIVANEFSDTKCE